MKASISTPGIAIYRFSSGLVTRLMMAPMWSYITSSSATSFIVSATFVPFRLWSEMRMRCADLLHYAALYLLYARLAVYHDVVKVVRQHTDDFLQIGVHAAIAALVLRAAYGEEGKALRLDHGVENAEPGLVEHLYGLARATVLRAFYHRAADIVQGGRDLDSQRRGQTYGGICVYRQYLSAGLVLRQHAELSQAASEVLPTPPLPASAIILALLSPICRPPPKYAKERVRRCRRALLSRHLLYI